MSLVTMKTFQTLELSKTELRLDLITLFMIVLKVMGSLKEKEVYWTYYSVVLVE